MLAIDNIVVRIAGREILSGATANLPAGRRIGLVGRNGAGKSTLFNVILGHLHPDDGDVSWPSAWKVSELASHEADDRIWNVIVLWVLSKVSRVGVDCHQVKRKVTNHLG